MNGPGILLFSNKLEEDDDKDCHDNEEEKDDDEGIGEYGEEEGFDVLFCGSDVFVDCIKIWGCLFEGLTLFSELVDGVCSDFLGVLNDVLDIV